MWVLPICSGLAGRQGVGGRSLYDRAWKWKLFMTPRVFAFLKNPFSGVAVSHLLPRTPGSFQGLGRGSKFTSSDSFQLINEDPQDPTRQFQRVCAPSSMWPPAREAHTRLKGQREKSFALSYLLGFPMNSLHLSPLWNVLVNELIYEHSQKPQDKKKKEQGFLDQKFIFPLFFLIHYPPVVSPPTFLWDRWWYLPQPADNSGYSIGRM